MAAQVIEVGNREFLLGLDELYRDRVKQFERTELLDCARQVTSELGVEPDSGPVEGYYAEDEDLSEYFRRMRALQQVPAARKHELTEPRHLERLQEIASSRLYGRPSSSMFLISAGDDSLSEALEAISPDRWTVETLVRVAYERARESDDYSLVGLAALAKDPVVLAGLRETVVLYARWIAAAARELPDYVWRVDPILEERARKFVATFNVLFDDPLPEPGAENARWYYEAGDLSALAGRCVRLGGVPKLNPSKYYHWAVKRLDDGDLAVEEFWANEVWTTERYSRAPRQ